MKHFRDFLFYLGLFLVYLLGMVSYFLAKKYLGG